MSYVDPEEGKKNESPAPAPKKEPLFILLEEIRDAINEKNAQSAHHLDKIAQSLERLSKSIETIARTYTPTEGMLARKEETKKPEVPVAPKSTPAPTPAPVPSSGIEKIKSAFTEDLIDMLSFDEKEDFVVIKPRRFLGSDNFAKIASIVRNLGGEYVSAGKDSHFKVPKK